MLSRHFLRSYYKREEINPPIRDKTKDTIIICINEPSVILTSIPGISGKINCITYRITTLTTTHAKPKVKILSGTVTIFNSLFIIRSINQITIATTTKARPYHVPLPATISNHHWGKYVDIHQAIKPYAAIRTRIDHIYLLHKIKRISTVYQAVYLCQDIIKRIYQTITKSLMKCISNRHKSQGSRSLPPFTQNKSLLLNHRIRPT